MASADVQLRSRGWLRNASRSPKVIVGFSILMFFVLLGVIGPHFVGNPSATSADAYASPSWAALARHDRHRPRRPLPARERDDRLAHRRLRRSA